MSKIFKRNKRINIRDIEVCLKVTDEDSLNIIKSIGINEEDLKYLRVFKNTVDNNINHIVDKFYEPISENKKLVDIINSHSSIFKLKKVMSLHLCEMFIGILDDNYINMRNKIAFIHQKIGLSVYDYIQSFDNIDKVFFSLLENIEHSDDRIEIFKAFQKILTLERQLVIFAYNAHTLKLEEKLKSKSKELNNKISESSTNLSSLSQQLNASLTTISNQTSNVVSNLKKVVNTNSDVGKNVDESEMFIELQRTAMSKLIKSSHNMISDLHSLKNMSLKIEEVISVISEISARTNLLALNAQIEASRDNSNSNNRAFGVIASQLRDLSDNVHKNVDHISYIIENILKTQNQLEDTTKSLSIVVNENEQALNDTSLKLKNMTESVKQSVELTDDIDVQMTSLDEVLRELNQAFNVIVEESEKLNELALELK